MDDSEIFEAIGEDGFLFEPPFQITAGGPIGNVTFDENEARVAQSGDDVFVRDAVPEHTIDHVALNFGGEATRPWRRILRPPG